MITRNTIIALVLLVGIAFMPVEALCIDEDDYEYFDSQQDDYIQVQILNDKITAFRSEKSSTPVKLELGEEILMQDEEGRVGAIVTNNRFLAVSTGSDAWLVKPLHLDETDSAELMVGEEIALLVTSERIIGFTSVQDRFVEYPLSVGDEVIHSETGHNLGVVILSDRAVGLSSKALSFNEIDFEYEGAFDSLEMAATLAMVRTEDHIYAYSALTGTWTKRSK